jgi:hypothetical protein
VTANLGIYDGTQRPAATTRGIDGLSVPAPSVGLRFLPGVIHLGWNNTALTMADGVTYYWPLVVTASVRFDAFAPFVNNAVASSSLRVAICRADSDWQPTELVAQGSAISSASTGEKLDVVQPVTIQPGRYLAAARSNGAIQLRGPTVHWFGIGIGEFSADSLFFRLQHMTVSEAFGSFSATPTRWTSTVRSSVQPVCPVMFRSAAP